MNKYILTLTMIFLSLLFCAAAQAQDGFLSNAKTLEKGTGSIAVQPVFLTGQDDFMLMIRGAYGIQRGMTGHFKVGLLDDETYVGGHFETYLNQNSNADIDVAAIAGVYTYGDIGLKLGLNLSTDIQNVSLYSGLNYQPLFASRTLHSILVPIGFDVHLANNVDLMMEGDIPVNDDANYLEAITFGARVYLN